MMISHSKAEKNGRSDQEAVITSEQVCEECDCQFEPVGEAVLCSDCVRKLFEPEIGQAVGSADKEHRFINYYRHEDCPVKPGIAWHNEGASVRYDECHACGRDISPYKSEDAETAAKAA